MSALVNEGMVISEKLSQVCLALDQYDATDTGWLGVIPDEFENARIGPALGTFCPASQISAISPVKAATAWGGMIEILSGNGSVRASIIS